MVMEGDIFIKLIDVTNLYGASDDLRAAYENKIKEYDTTLENEDELSANYSRLNEYGLLFNPHFKLKIGEDEIIDVFTTEKEYSKLRPYLNNLNRDSEKIHLKLEIDKKDSRNYYTNNIISIKKMEGKTDWEK